MKGDRQNFNLRSDRIQFLQERGAIAFDTFEMRGDRTETCGDEGRSPLQPKYQRGSIPVLEKCGSGKLVQFNIVVQQALRYSR